MSKKAKDKIKVSASEDIVTGTEEKPSSDTIRSYFTWSEENATDEAKDFLDLMNDEILQLSAVSLNQIFRKHNGEGYEISDKIGGGGYGSVYELLDLNDSGLCVKVIDLFVGCNKDGRLKNRITNRDLILKKNAVFEEHFRHCEREFRINQAISENHLENCVPFIPQLSFVDHSVRPFLTFLVMKRMDGDIAERPILLRNDYSNRRIALKMLDEILRAMDMTNIFRITSRDIRPENIMYQYEGKSDLHFYLGDFGIGTFNTPNFSTVRRSDYQDKEWQAVNQDIRSDMYSLALTAAYVDSGFEKNQSGNPRDMHDTLNDLRKNGTDDPLYQILCKATDPEPDQRYQTPDEMRTAVLISQVTYDSQDKKDLEWYKKIEALEEKSRQEKDSLRNRYDENLKEYEMLNEGLNARVSEMQGKITELEDGRIADYAKIESLKKSFDEQREKAKKLAEDNGRLESKIRSLEESLVKKTEGENTSLYKYCMDPLIFACICAVVAVLNFVLNIIVCREGLSIAFYILTTVLSLCYIWLLYDTRRINVKQYAGRGFFNRLNSSMLVSDRTLRISCYALMLGILLVLPAVNILRYFTKIRTIGTDVRIAYFEKWLKIAFQTNTICLFIACSAVLFILLAATFAFSYSRKKADRIEISYLGFAILCGALILFETGSYFLAGYNTLGFERTGDETKIYWHNPENSIARASRISQSSLQAIRLYNDGKNNLTYDAENGIIVFTDSTILKPLYFEGNTKIRLSGTCTFDNQTDETAANINVRNGYLYIYTDENTVLNMNNDKGQNLVADRYIAATQKEGYLSGTVNCNSNDACIYAGYGTNLNTGSFEGTNNSTGYYVYHDNDNNQYPNAEHFTVTVSETGVEQTYPIDQIETADSYITGARYDADSRQIILNNAAVSAPLKFDGNVTFSVNGECVFENSSQFADNLITVENGGLSLYFAENATLSMTNHNGADIYADGYVFSNLSSGRTLPSFTCNTENACIYSGYISNINIHNGVLKNENENGRILSNGVK